METGASPGNAIHSAKEIDNYQATSQSIDDWLISEWPSISIIPPLHAQLLLDVEDYGKRGLIKSHPGEFRKEDVRASGEPENFYVRGTDVDPVIRQYCRDLDTLLTQLPAAAEGNLEEIVHGAAWAYYVFERIHPFLDGNGRTGRLILNRVIRGAGLDPFVFLDNWFDVERKTHLQAMILVGRTGDLAPLELYLLHSMRTNKNNQPLLGELEEVIAKKEQKLLNSDSIQSLSNIWDTFSSLDIADTSEMAGDIEKVPAMA